MPETPKPGSFDVFLATAPRSTDPAVLWEEYLKHLQSQKPNARYVGLLIKYEHVDRIGNRDLISDPVFDDLRIIHLVRRNTLRMLASHHLAVARGVHVSSEPLRHDMSSVDLPVDDLLRRLRKKTQLVEAFRGHLDQRPQTCEIAYEDIMSGDTVSEDLVSTLCEFFMVEDNFARQPKTVKLGPERLRDMIGNYSAVASALSGTEFETMLE